MFAQAVNIVWDAGGGAVIYDQNPLSQAFRDANAAARHLTHGTSTRPRMVAS